MNTQGACTADRASQIVCRHALLGAQGRVGRSRPSSRKDLHVEKVQGGRSPTCSEKGGAGTAEELTFRRECLVSCRGGNEMGAVGREKTIILR